MKISKTIFDYTLAFILLIILALPIGIAWLIATIETGHNGMFIQKRIGKNGKPFKIFKIRSMKGSYQNPITTEETHDITTSGKLFIKYKIDELPQLLNILNGTMSFVGPRPDVEGYADKLHGEAKIILTVKPGITGPAQIKYRHEHELLAAQDDPKRYNDEVLWPDKVRINIDYVKNWSFIGDIHYLWRTIF